MINSLPPHAAKGRAGRVLVLILAFNAERHICGVLEQIPGALLNYSETHFLVLDDASDDAGVEAALRWVADADVTNVTVLRHGVNQGYGGNQKLGFRLALDCSFDFAVLLHGDGQYSPTLLPDLIEVWRRILAVAVEQDGEVERAVERQPVSEFLISPVALVDAVTQHGDVRHVVPRDPTQCGLDARVVRGVVEHKEVHLAGV